MAWKKFHKCDPYPSMDGLKDGDQFQCDGCGRIIQYWHSNEPVDSPMGIYAGSHGFREVK